MFTQSVIKLSEINNFSIPLEFKVERDAEFSFVGKIHTKLQGRVVPCSTVSQVQIANTIEEITGIITTAEIAKLVHSDLGLVITPFPMQLAYILQDKISLMDGFQWVNFPTKIHPSAVIHPKAVISEFNVVVGKFTRIGPGVSIGERTIIGDYTSIDANSIIGCIAFEVNQAGSPQYIIKQSGGVLIGENVEILAGCTIARATFGGFTRLGDNVKIDCQVHIGHDCDISKNVRIATSAVLSGRVSVGQDVYIGPNAVISNGLDIGDGAFITLGSVVIGNISSKKKVSGNYAVDHHKWLRAVIKNSK